ncbi:MAG TPA: hypothetical protein VF432_32090 [Thermoanaerobaculia bacterium]
MSEVRIVLRGCLLVMAALVLNTCASSPATNPSKGGGTLMNNPCGKGLGKADRNAPIVCVDDTGGTLSVHPDPITAHSVGQSDRQAVMLHWWTRSGGNALNIEIEPGCVTDVTCNGAHCSARTLPANSRTRCKYDVWTDKHPRLDPDIVVDPCC